MPTTAPIQRGDIAPRLWWTLFGAVLLTWGFVIKPGAPHDDWGAVIGLLATPVSNTFSRWVEADADHFSVVHFNEPDGLAKALVKTIEYRADSPSKLEEFLFYDHPSVEHRVRSAMDWKAAHLADANAKPKVEQP